MNRTVNPETLSTWRDDAPPADLRARALAPTRASPLPRLGLAVAALAGAVALAVLAGSPRTAYALEPRAFLAKAQRAYSAAPRVHLREFSDGSLVSETWFDRDLWRVTSPVGEGGDRIFRRTRFNITIKPDPKSGETYDYAVGIEPGRTGTTTRVDASGRVTRMDTIEYISRRNGKIVTMSESAPQRRDFRMEAVSPTLFGKAAKLVYRDLGRVRDGRRIEVTTFGSNRRLLWLVRSADGLPVRMTAQSRVLARWRDDLTTTFEYPSAMPKRIFDPQTLAEHGL